MRRVGALIGLVLLCAALVLAWRQREVVRQALGSIQQLPTRVIVLNAAILFGSVIANLFLSGMLFGALTSRYGKVGFIEMQALIASATLLNFVPMRAGMLGRIAYHKAYNQIGVAQSATVIVQAVVLSGGAAAYVVLAVLTALRVPVSLWLLMVLPLAVLGVAAAIFRPMRVFIAAAAIRYLDLLVTAARYHAAFALIGSPINVSGALAFACISIIATMVPFLSNGLGLREWTIGLVAPLLTPYQMTLGITADLVNRAAEIIVAVIMGLIGMVVLARIQTHRASDRSG
jgi:hypothetical protein